MPVPLAYHTSSVHDNWLYILGGTSTNFEKSKNTTFYRLNLETKLWERLKSPDENKFIKESFELHNF